MDMKTAKPAVNPPHRFHRCLEGELTRSQAQRLPANVPRGSLVLRVWLLGVIVLTLRQIVLTLRQIVLTLRQTHSRDFAFSLGVYFALGSVIMPIDLLKNRDLTAPLGSFDGNVGALVTIGEDEYFITTNADYVPALPTIELNHSLTLQSDCRYGKDDPMVWPQQFCPKYSHLAVLAKKGARTDLEVMWWDPKLNDFIVVNSVTPGLGRVHPKYVDRFLLFINDIVDRVRRLRNESKGPLPSIFGHLCQQVVRLVERIQTLPAVYLKTVLAVTSLQRACLELDAAYEYWTVYKPRMEDFLASHRLGPALAPCISAYTSDLLVAQQLYAARIPFWLLRPTSVFAQEIILKVVAPIEPHFKVLDPVDNNGRIVMPNTLTTLLENTTKAKFDAINAAVTQARWYRDPLETLKTRLPLPVAVASSLKVTTPSSSMSRSANKPYPSQRRPNQPGAANSFGAKHSRNKMYSSANKQGGKKMAGVQTERNKFQPLDSPLMPVSIISWQRALASVNQDVTSLSTNLDDRRYVLPEPALFASTTPEGQRRRLHHWNLLRDVFVFVLSDRENETTPSYSGQQWRDVLDGFMTARGDAQGTFHERKKHRRTTKLEDLIRPALNACNVETVQGFPVPSDSLPKFTEERAREIIWEVAETGFRYEFCALDRRASLKEREDDVKQCFAGGMLIGAPLEKSQRGFAAATLEQRHPYFRRAASLMLDWTSISVRPTILAPNFLAHLDGRGWGNDQKEDLETAVCEFYTQTFWEYFGRAAIMPMRLEHVVSMSM
ncbi:hypothetical protein C8F01DRAFT_1251759 [Mycena amicta]|nr:hypothetical protein C8F01DRAFT_1251759 [Mycena amicta]